MFQMGFVTRIDDDVNQVQTDDKIAFDRMAFGADRLGNLHLQDPEPYVQEEEQPSFVCPFLARLEDAMEAGLVELAHRMNR